MLTCHINSINKVVKVLCVHTSLTQL